MSTLPPLPSVRGTLKCRHNIFWSPFLRFCRQIVPFRTPPSQNIRISMEDRQQSYRRPPKRPSLRQSSSVSSSASTSASPPAQPSALNRGKGRAIHDPRLEEDPFGEEYTVEVSTNDSEDEVEENNLIEDDQGGSSSRGKKAWAARKARRVERLREAEKYIHIPPSMYGPENAKSILTRDKCLHLQSPPVIFFKLSITMPPTSILRLHY